MNVKHFLVIFVVIAPVVNGNFYTFLGDVATFLVELTRIQNFIFPKYKSVVLEDRYDFIIVGSGPTGLVLSNRITENEKVTVLVLEKGDEPSFITDIPLIVPALEFSSFNYGYKSQPQEQFCHGCSDNRLELPHGDVLGGSSVINYLIFVRGSPHDYDKWAAMGNPGWSYDEMLPYLKKMEDARVRDSDEEYRGKGGYLTVSDIPYRSKLVDVYVNACMEAGYNYVDYNGRTQLGVSYIQGTTRDGFRCSAEKAYLRPVRQRRNLKIKLNSQVTRILIHPENKTAYGVEYLNNGSRYYAYANKEVILAAGSLNSPQVLMLSGIGDKDHLDELGIRVEKELPVGKKMFDHAACPVVMYEVNQSITINLVKELINPESYIGLSKNSGVFTSIGGVEAITYFKTKFSTDMEDDYPDVELLMVGINVSSDYGVLLRKITNIPPPMYNKLFRPLEGKYVYQVTPVVLHPKSHGYIKLNTSNPEGAPLLYANFFSDPENHDIKTMIAGIREFQRINLAPSLQKVGATLVDIPVPGCEQHQFDSDLYWECALRTIIGSYYHQVATCKMGPKSDPEAVVDPQLRVYGIKNLRVTDTSIIPAPPSSHTVGMAYVIGEKAADMIKKFHNI